MEKEGQRTDSLDSKPLRAGSRGADGGGERREQRTAGKEVSVADATEARATMVTAYFMMGSE